METPEQIAEFNRILAVWRDNFVDKHKGLRCPNRDQHEEFYEIDDVHYTGWGAFSYHFKACCYAYEMEIQPILLQEKMYNPPNLNPAAVAAAPAAAAPPTVKASADRWFEEVWNQHKSERIKEWVSPGCKMHGLGEGTMTGPEAFAAFHAHIHSGMPDLRVRVNHQVVEDDMVASMIEVSGTHTGELLGFAPTGEKVRVTAVVFSHWKNGQIIEAWNLTDAEKALKGALTSAGAV